MLSVWVFSFYFSQLIAKEKPDAGALYFGISPASPSNK